MYSKSEGEMVGCVSRDENKQRGSGKYDDKHVISGGVRRCGVFVKDKRNIQVTLQSRIKGLI